MLESIAKSKANSRFATDQKRVVPLPSTVTRRPIPRQPVPNAKNADGVEKLHIRDNHVQPKMQLVFAATEKAILELSVYQRQ